MPAKSSRWYGSSLASAAFRASSVSARIISRIASMRSPSKNMCSVRHRPMPTAPNAIAFCVCSGVSALVRTLMRVACSHHFISCWKLLNFSVFFAASSPSSSPATISDGAVLTWPAKTLPAVPSIDIQSPSLNVLAVDGHRARVIVHFHRGRAADADLAHLPGHERRVRRHAAAGGENAFGGNHAAEIFRRRLDAHEQHRLALVRRGHRAIGVEIDPAGRRARTGRQTGGDRLLALATSAASNTGASSCSSWSAGLRITAVFQSISFSLHHVHRELQRRHRRALAVARLQHVDDAVLDRELEVLHVLEVALECLANRARAR